MWYANAYSKANTVTRETISDGNLTQNAEFVQSTIIPVLIGDIRGDNQKASSVSPPMFYATKHQRVLKYTTLLWFLMCCTDSKYAGFGSWVYMLYSRNSGC